MNIKNFCTVVIMGLTIMGCATKKNKEPFSEIQVFDITAIPEDPESLPLSSIAESVRYVPLETNEEALISYVRKIIKDDHSYYILSGHAILRYNEEGKFLSKLDKRGKGPGEYNAINDFDISPSGQIMAISTWNKILFYHLDGTFFKFIECNANYIDFIDGHKLLTYRTNIMGNEEYSNLIINIEGDTIAKFPNRFKFELKNTGVGLPSWEYVRHRFENELFVSEIHDDTLFRVTKENTLLPHHVFYTGGHRITADVRSDGTYFQQHFNDLIYLCNIMESSRYILYTFPGKGSVYDKEKRLSHHFKELTNDIDGGLNFSPSYASGKNNFLSVIETSKLKEHVEDSSFNEIKEIDHEARKEFEQLVNMLSIEDNPVLMLVKLKN